MKLVKTSSLKLRFLFVVLTIIGMFCAIFLKPDYTTLGACSVILIVITLLLFRSVEKRLAEVNNAMMSLSGADADFATRVPLYKTSIQCSLTEMNLSINTFLEFIDNEFADTLSRISCVFEHSVPVSQTLIKAKRNVKENVETANRITLASEKIHSNINDIALIIDKSFITVCESLENTKTCLQTEEKYKESIFKTTNIINSMGNETDKLTFNIEKLSKILDSSDFSAATSERIKNLFRDLKLNVSIIFTGAQSVVHAVEARHKYIEDAFENVNAVNNAVENLTNAVKKISVTVHQQNETTNELTSSAQIITKNAEQTEAVTNTLINDINMLISCLAGITGKYVVLKHTSKSRYFEAAKIGYIHIVRLILNSVLKEIPARLPDHNTNSFGRFYYGYGKEMFEKDNEYKALAKNYEQTYEKGKAIMEKLAANETDGIVSLTEELKETVKDTISKLNILADKYR